MSQNKNSHGTIEDVKEGVSILEKVVNIFKTILELFKKKK